MYGVIDIGSNSIRLSVFQVEEDGGLTPLFQRKEMTGLAGYVDEKGNLTAQGIRRAAQTLERFHWTLEKIAVEETFVFATASLRNVRNTKQVVEALAQSAGYSVQVLSGREEALLDYRGARMTLGGGDGLLVDIGGGSTELVGFRSGKVEFAASMPVGSLNLFKRHVSALLPTQEELREIRQTVRGELEHQKLPDFQTDRMCGIGGTARNTCKLCNEWFGRPVEERGITDKELKRMLDRCKHPNKAHMDGLLQVMPERIHTITPGMVILQTVARRFGCRRISVCQQGVGEGYLLEVLTERGSLHVR